MAKKTRKFDGKTYNLVKTTQNKVDAKKRAERIRGDEYGSFARVTHEKVRGEKLKYYKVWMRKGLR
jgi:hypothetical protein